MTRWDGYRDVFRWSDRHTKRQSAARKFIVCFQAMGNITPQLRWTSQRKHGSPRVHTGKAVD
jgi:hypothetical protein